MDLKVEKKESNICVINVTIDAKKSTQEYEKACKRIAQNVNIEGFRRGKAPRAILEQRIGVDAIKNEAIFPNLDDIDKYELYKDLGDFEDNYNEAYKRIKS